MRKGLRKDRYQGIEDKLQRSDIFVGKNSKQADAYEAVGFKSEARDFSSAGKILKNLSVRSIRMLTNNPDKVKTVGQYGIEVVGTRDIVL